MSTPSQVATALTALWTAALTVPVYDGPRPTGGNDPQFVLVGSAGADEDWLTLDHAWSPLGNRWVDENGTITCTAWAWSGDAAPAAAKALRDQSTALAYACEAALRADPTVGGTLSDDYGPARVSTMVGRVIPSGKGPSARVLFTVAFTNLLT